MRAALHFKASEEEIWTMNPTLFEMGLATLMVAVSVVLVAWFWRYTAVASERRTMHMLAGTGVGHIMWGDARTKAIMQDVRERCRRCPSEGLCERWLAGSVQGDNSFCPNAQIFRKLTNAAGRIAL
jgi:hypothetical protein